MANKPNKLRCLITCNLLQCILDVLVLQVGSAFGEREILLGIFLEEINAATRRRLRSFFFFLLIICLCTIFCIMCGMTLCVKACFFALYYDGLGQLNLMNKIDNLASFFVLMRYDFLGELLSVLVHFF